MGADPCGRFPRPAHPPLRCPLGPAFPTAGSPPKPPTGLIFCKADTPGPPSPHPHGKINFLETRRFRIYPFAKPSALAPGHYNHLGRGRHPHCKGWRPGFSRRPNASSPDTPQTTGANPRSSFFNFPPQHIINKLLQLRTERRKSSNFEALGISKSRTKIQNKCSFVWSPPLLFFFFLQFCSTT